MKGTAERTVMLAHQVAAFSREPKLKSLNTYLKRIRRQRTRNDPEAVAMMFDRMIARQAKAAAQGNQQTKD